MVALSLVLVLEVYLGPAQPCDDTRNEASTHSWESWSAISGSGVSARRLSGYWLRDL